MTALLGLAAMTAPGLAADTTAGGAGPENTQEVVGPAVVGAVAGLAQARAQVAQAGTGLRHVRTARMVQSRQAGVLRPIGTAGQAGVIRRVGEDHGGRVQSLAPPAGNTITADCASGEKGDGAAAYRVARRYLFGLGMPRNPRMGITWLRLAATYGHPDAQRLIQSVPRAWGHGKPSCSAGPGSLRGRPMRTPMPPPPEIIALVKKLAPDYGLEPGLVLAVMQVESGFRSDVVSPKAAAGLMQLIPGTAERFGVQNVFDPEDNIRGGMKYLRWLLAYFEGRVPLALAGYNAGEGAVNRYGGIPPYAETQAYVRLVRQLYPQDTHPFEAGLTQRSAMVSRQTADAGP